MTDTSKQPRFLQPRDLVTFLITTLVSLIVYVRGLPPTVTLEDAGELAVAADYLGVPHPPGYPIWTFLAWFFQWIFHGVDYNGYPNPAWSIALMSAVFGALACGIIGMLISKSSRMMVENLRPGKSVLLQQKKPWGIGMGIGLLICVLFQANQTFGGLLLGVFTTALIVAGIIRGFKEKDELAGFAAKLPDLSFWGACFYGSLIGVVGFFVAWTRVSIASIGTVLPLAILSIALIAALFLVLDFAMARISNNAERLQAVVTSRLDVFAGIGGGLLLAFSPLMWSQAEIVEVYSLNSFFMAVLMLSTFWYLCRPSEKVLYVTAFLFALGLTNHQSLLFLVFFLLAGVAASRQKTIFGDALKFMLIAGMILVVTKIQHYSTLVDPVTRQAAPDSGAVALFSGLLVYIGLLLTLLIYSSKNLVMNSYKQLGIMLLLGVLGLGFHGFMPFSSEQNPPMNWGYPRTVKGFKHALLRGQYAKFSVADNIKRMSKGMSQEMPELKTDISPEEQNMSLEQHRLSRVYFFRQLGVFFTGVSGVDSLYDKYSIANTFSLQFPAGPVDPTGHTPPPPEIDIPLAMLGLLPLLLFPRFGDASRSWFHTCLIGMFFLTIVFMIIQWPELNHNDLFVKRVQYIQAHALFTVWMAYGAVLLLVLLYGLIPSRAILGAGGLALCILYAWFPLHKNAQDPRHIEYLGSSSLNGHDFGWQFGFYQLKGANGLILDELAHHKNPDCKLTDWAIQYLLDRGFTQEQVDQAVSLAGSEALGRKQFVKKVVKNIDGLDPVRQRQVEHAGLIGAYRLLSKEEQAANLKFHHAPLPSLDYPPEMDQDAVFFGGTDPGRFVPTYMIYSADCRPDVYLITQNALADPTYLDTMRDLYGDQIWIPSVLDSNTAFREYGDDLRIYSPEKFASMTSPDGRVQVSGVNEVMQINFILAKNIFDHNNFRHSFYVEESYMIPWMYDYVSPHGLILKVNKEKYELTPEDIENDFAFWDWYVAKLTETYKPAEEREWKFRRDLVARKTFSKLRGAIGGLYMEKGHPEEAERAFKQSLELYPASPEATFRLADVYSKMQRFDDAQAVVDRFSTFDPTNKQVGIFGHALRQMRSYNEKRLTFEDAMQKQPSLNAMLHLIQYYAMLHKDKEMEAFARQIIPHQAMPPAQIRVVAETMRQKRNLELYRYALETIVRRDPNDRRALYDLAALDLSEEKYKEALAWTAEAVRRGGNTARREALGDIRLGELKGFPQYKKLMTPTQTRQQPVVPIGPGRRNGATGLPTFGR